MLSNKTGLSAAIVVASMISSANLLHATPLPDGTLLSIAPGADQDLTGQCQTGSCFGMEVSPGFFVWTQLGPGTDGGIVVGKNQLSGGQELAPSGTNTTPGDMTAVWNFWVYGTFYADQSQNIYSDSSNTGETVINHLNMAWNGSDVPFGGGTVNDYTLIQLDAGTAYYSLEYSVTTPADDPSGFGGISALFLIRSEIPVAPGGNVAPVVDDVRMTVRSGLFEYWEPTFTDYIGDFHVCAITSSASNGSETVNTTCSLGAYTPDSGFEGQDSFRYSVTDQYGLSGEGTVFVDVLPATTYPCVESVPLKQVSTTGGGQGASVNGTLVTTFTGHITTEAGLTSGGKNTVKICPGTSTGFSAISSVGEASCTVNGSATSATGNLTQGDKLLCSNKPDGSDTDRFVIKDGL